MLCRTVLTAIAISYLLCVLLLSGIQKEDMDVNLLRKLARYNVNIHDTNNDNIRQECLQKSSLVITDTTTPQLQGNNYNQTTIELPVTTESNTIEITSTVPSKPLKAVNIEDKYNYTEKLKPIDHQMQKDNIIATSVMKIQSQELNISKGIDQIEYEKNQPTMESVLNFWKKITRNSISAKAPRIYTTVSTKKVLKSNNNKNYVQSSEIGFTTKTQFTTLNAPIKSSIQESDDKVIFHNIWDFPVNSSKSHDEKGNLNQNFAVKLGSIEEEITIKKDSKFPMHVAETSESTANISMAKEPLIKADSNIKFLLDQLSFDTSLHKKINSLSALAVDSKNKPASVNKSQLQDTNYSFPIRYVTPLLHNNKRELNNNSIVKINSPLVQRLKGTKAAINLQKQDNLNEGTTNISHNQESNRDTPSKANNGLIEQFNLPTLTNSANFEEWYSTFIGSNMAQPAHNKQKEIISKTLFDANSMRIFNVKHEDKPIVMPFEPHDVIYNELRHDVLAKENLPFELNEEPEREPMFKFNTNNDINKKTKEIPFLTNNKPETFIPDVQEANILPSYHNNGEKVDVIHVKKSENINGNTKFSHFTYNFPNDQLPLPLFNKEVYADGSPYLEGHSDNNIENNFKDRSQNSQIPISNIHSNIIPPNVQQRGEDIKFDNDPRNVRHDQSNLNDITKYAYFSLLNKKLEELERNKQMEANTLSNDDNKPTPRINSLVFPTNKFDSEDYFTYFIKKHLLGYQKNGEKVSEAYSLEKSPFINKDNLAQKDINTNNMQFNTVSTDPMTENEKSRLMTKSLQYIDKILRLNEDFKINGLNILSIETTTKNLYKSKTEKNKYKEITFKPHELDTTAVQPRNTNISLKQSDDKGNIESIPGGLIQEIAENVKRILLKDIQKDIPTTVKTTSISTVTTTIATETITTTLKQEVNKTQDVKYIMQQLLQLVQDLQSTTNRPKPSTVEATKITNNPTKATESYIEKREYKIPINTFPYPMSDPYQPEPYILKPHFENAPAPFMYPYQQLNNLKMTNVPLLKPEAIVMLQPSVLPRKRLYPAPITIQTNSHEIAPLNITLAKAMKPIIHQVIIVTTKHPFVRLKDEHQHWEYNKWKYDNFNKMSDTRIHKDNSQIRGEQTAKRMPPESYKHHEYSRDIYRNRTSKYSQNPIHYNYGGSQRVSNYRSRLRDPTYEYGRPRPEIKNFHERLENIDDWSKSDRGRDKTDCCDEVASRQQVPISNLKQSSRYNDVHFRNFLKTQQKVNDMLERILSTKAVDRPRSVETP